MRRPFCVSFLGLFLLAFTHCGIADPPTASFSMGASSQKEPAPVDTTDDEGEPDPTPPPTCLPGDANCDGCVDGADYTIWADHYLQNFMGPAFGDFSNNGLVDGGDYTIWADNFAPCL